MWLFEFSFFETTDNQEKCFENIANFVSATLANLDGHKTIPQNRWSISFGKQKYSDVNSLELEFDFASYTLPV